jgi:multiple sugar transport system permease protein
MRRVLVGVGILFALAPIWIQIVGAISSPGLWPDGVNLAAFQKFIDRGGLRWFLNSVWITSLAAIGQVAIAGLASYAFAWKDFTGKTILFWLLMASMILPTHALIVPRFVVVQKLGLTGHLGLMLAYWTVGASVFLLRQFCKSLDKGIIEAARVDGASELRIIIQIALPMMAPALVFVGITTFSAVWVDLFWPAMLLKGDNMTLATGLFYSSQAWENGVDRAMWIRQQMAGGVLSFMPLVVLFALFQDKLSRGYAESWE